MAVPAGVLVRLLRAPSVTGEPSAEEDQLWDAPNGGLPDPASVIELHLSSNTSLPSYSLTAFSSLRVLHACMQTQLPNLALPPSLTSLNLDRSPIRDLNCLRVLTSLVSLSLSGSRVDGFADFLPLLSLSALRLLVLQPTPSTDPWTHVGGIGASPVCATPSYRAYVLRTFPQLTHLDGIAADHQRAISEFATHFQTTPSDFPYRGVSPCSSSLPTLLCNRASGQSAAAVRRCAASIVAREARVGEAKPRLKRLLDPHAPLPLPRQFEYHPLLPDRLLVGSSTGELTLINPETGARISSVLARTGHAMLGLSWLRSPSHSHLCVAGSDDGSVGMWAAEGRSFKRVIDFPPFSQLTSLNVNCTDDRCVASGYSEDVLLYDITTGRQLSRFEHAHSRHINVLKFAYHSPHLFATSSFDHTVKLWDLRTPYDAERPVWTARGGAGLGFVMVCFSPDDCHLLASGVDNDVRLLDVVDGRTSLAFPIRRRNSRANFTRSYFLNHRDYIITGSCEESSVRLYCAHTGRFFRAVDFAHMSQSGSSVYCQSLRGDPHRDFHFSVLLCETPAVRAPSIVSTSLLDAPIQEGHP